MNPHAMQQNIRQDKVFILSCSGKSAHGRLVNLAAQELILEKKAAWLTMKMAQELLANKSTKTENDRIIVVDGCAQRCGLQFFQGHGISPEFHLVLEDIGISEKCEEFSGDELQLIKDAIIAVSTRVSDKIPMIPGCCC